MFLLGAWMEDGQILKKFYGEDLEIEKLSFGVFSQKFFTFESEKS